MRKITLFVAGVALFVLIGIGFASQHLVLGTHWLARLIRHR